MALVFDKPMVILNILLISVLTYLTVKYVISRFLLIYGKRRFIACVLIALLFKFVLNLFYPYIPFDVFAFTGIGVVTCGILANCYFRQGVILSATAAVVTSGVTFLLINIAYIL